MDKVCVIIVTYNSMPWIDNCLQALSNSTYPIDYVIIDNNSTDGTVNYIEKRYVPTKLIKSVRNLGFGGANNIGLEWGLANDYDYFLLLNQDAYLNPDTIRILVEQFTLNVGFGILSPLHYEGKGVKLDRLFENYIRNNQELQNDVSKENYLEKVYEVPFVNAACWLLPKKTLEQVGLFHPLIFHYGEDDNYVHRLHSLGLKIGIVGSAKVLHDRDQTAESGLKSDFNNSFERQVLVELLKPDSKVSFVSGFSLAKKIGKSIYWRNNQQFTMVAHLSCMLKYTLLRIRVLWYNTLHGDVS